MLPVWNFHAAALRVPAPGFTPARVDSPDPGPEEFPAPAGVPVFDCELTSQAAPPPTTATPTATAPVISPRRLVPRYSGRATGELGTGPPGIGPPGPSPPGGELG